MFNPKALLLLCIIMFSCKQPVITGHWKLQNRPDYKIPGLHAVNADAGDLTLLSDSTYLIKGISNATSNTPGWHTGGDEKGSWKGSGKDTLILFPDNLRQYIPESWQSNYRTSYKIVQLSQDELVLAALDSSRNMRRDSLVRYQRK
ncbi:hypothetical protein [Ferruginibacter sp.]